MRMLAVLAAVLAGACAHAQDDERAAHPLPAPRIASCDGAADDMLCLLRLGMHDPEGYDAREYGAFVELANADSITAIRAALAFGLDRGPDAITLGDHPQGHVVMQRAIMAALRSDAAGAAPEAALAPIDALAETDRPSMAPGGVRFRAYVELARWESALAPRPSAPLVRLALLRAEALANSDQQLEARNNFIASIADAYGTAGLSGEGVAFVQRAGAGDDYELLGLAGDLDAAEAATMRTSARASCPAAARAEGLGTLAFYARLRDDAARESRLIEAGLEAGVEATTRCPEASVRFPALSRITALRGADAARAAARRLAPFTGSMEALTAQRDVYDNLRDDAEICRIANRQAALPTLTGEPLAYVIDGQSYCAPALQAWQDRSLLARTRLLRGIDAGVSMDELEAFIQSTEDRSIDFAVSEAASRMLEAGRMHEARRFAALDVRLRFDGAVESLENLAGDRAWRGLLHSVVAPNLIELPALEARRDNPAADPGRPASRDDQERARRAAAAVLQYELEAGLRTLPP